MATETFKRGATFEVEAAITDDAGAALVADVANMQAQLRHADNSLLVQLDIATTATPGTYLLSTDEDTSDWLLEIIKTDLRIVIDGKVRYTNTEYYRIIDQETEPVEPPVL